MRNLSAPVAMILGVVLAAFAAAEEPRTGEMTLLWEIGVADNSTDEFALAPRGFGEYRNDALFAVGHSDAKSDWPYVLPGPADTWAGSQPHEAAVVFSLDAVPGSPCRLSVDLVDTQHAIPPRLVVTANGRELAALQMPAGAGDASVTGAPAKGREHRFTVDVPADVLVKGANELILRTTSGSWMLFDWLALEAPSGTRLGPPPTATVVRGVQSAPLLVEKDGKLEQIVEIIVRHFGEPVEATILVGDATPVTAELRGGATRLEAAVPAVDEETPRTVEVKVGDKTLARGEVTLKPVRKWSLYLLPHSHVDIGYTKVQTEVEEDHWRFYEQAIEASRRTVDYPPGAQFKWNAEVLWATDSYLRQATPEKQNEFLDAVRKGWIGLDALYGNELTALCRPEELVRLVDYAGRISVRAGVKIDSAMISDVPGYTWGLTTVLAEAGVKYFSIGPNGGHRIGHTLRAWGDKPFWWTTPTGKARLLVWIPRTGYYRAFTTGEQALELVRRVEASDYAYDMIQVRFCLGDNAGPGVELSELVKDWNTKYAWPKLIISTTSEMMREFERRYGNSLPVVSGDFTPYWEDGAASSALETGLNRAAAERLSQAEALYAMLQPQAYPAEEFDTAWRNVILYDEHTWGAHNSISEPDSDFARSQWAIKQAFALDADAQSRKLLSAAVSPVSRAEKTVAAVIVFNTSNWPRTDLVILPADVHTAGDAVFESGQPVPSQRLADGTLAFMATELPALGAKHYVIQSGPPHVPAVPATASTDSLSNGLVAVALDAQSGAIKSLKAKSIAAELSDDSTGLGLNAYRYVAGRTPDNPLPNGEVALRVVESGPLVASVVVESAAPGCRKLSRQLRLVAGMDHIDMLNVVDKEKIRTPEGVHFGFALRVPGGVMRMDTPLAVVRPEEDQMEGACKNYFTVSRWLDVSNDQYGATWATIDAPLVEVGGIRVDVPKPFEPSGWLEHIEPSQTFYSYVMNNYWETNYKADQEGPTRFRYALRPHVGGYEPLAAARFGVERSQPLVAVPVAAYAPAPGEPRLRISGEAIVTAIKPSRDGKAIMVRLFGAKGAPCKARLEWADPKPARVCASGFTEKPGASIGDEVEVPAYGLVTIRAEL